ncbi:MAG: leucyl/phenylalanyl-tRNA--protein transferase [Chitinophagales bacterium]|nr:leucyl/phenylalanyl-tRNA--protein transferase [Chitinophagales bacterium]MDW8393263.1 leucyl/phenylalanyl-tRNA--protein transferase [Chitinophagales bacterium]
MMFVLNFISDGDFPDPQQTLPDGLVCLSKRFTASMVLKAYRQGIFPWFREGGFVHWYCPPQRMILYPGQLHISHSLKTLLNSKRFSVTVNRCFQQVITQCARTHLRQKGSTWIDQAFVRVYSKLHELRKALSIEVWQNDRLAGGLYGVVMGSMLCGESIFSQMPDAGKVALVFLCRELPFTVIDCQVPSPFLEQMGGTRLPRKQFLQLLSQCLSEKDRWPEVSAVPAGNS